MVRALLAGTKTQTRRAVRKQFAPDAAVAEVAATTPEGWQVSGHSGLWWDDAGACIDDAIRCPYGMPGDRLWVRESFIHEPADYCWEASVSIPSRPAVTVYRADAEDPRGGRWTPSIHMPRALSRITLEVTGVRVERLQDISEADAIAEGVEPMDTDRSEREFDRALCSQCGGTGLYTAFGPSGGAMPDTDCRKCDTHAKRYRWLWESINGPGSWDANPWVWCVEFRRLEV
jgi:hypothetical protein